MEVTVIKEDVIVDDGLRKQLTSDCHFVHLVDGVIDVVRGSSMVRIFDYYHDKGKRVVKIEYSGGQRNPKLQEPTIDKDK